MESQTIATRCVHITSCIKWCKAKQGFYNAPQEYKHYLTSEPKIPHNNSEGDYL